MTSLRIHLLGNPVFDLSGEPVDDFVSEKAVALLGYLVVQYGSLAREKLADLLWGDMPATRAKANLRMAIYNLQQLFPGYLQATRLKVAFNHELDYWLDVEQFENHLAKDPQFLSRPIEQFDSALSLYRGEFMQGISLSGSPELDEWLLLERERYRQLALQVFQNYAARLMSSGQYSQVVNILQELLRLEPWQESAHRQLMLAQARGGNYTAALEQYEVCRQLLADELNIEPMPETAHLYERIRTARDLPFRHNLPSQPTPFIGREAALDELTKLLLDDSRRLVTISGPGGAGKSRLALQTASGLSEAFLHGVYQVPLASLPSAEHLIVAVGAALGLSFRVKEYPREQLLRYLQHKELLLVLDNCEHLAGVADFVNDILRSTQEVKILATSRKRLNLVEEWLFEVQGLDYPASESGQTWTEYSALRLFVESARRVHKDFQPQPDELAHIVRICRLVEGLPLAIELAATCIRYYPCHEIAAEIENGFDILSANWLDMPARHRSMRAVFEHSWGLLLPEVQQVLRQLAIFRGGFTHEAAYEIAGASAETLNALVDRSLLRWNAPVAGSRRYDLHELLRQYASQQLIEAGEQAATATRHLDFLLRLAETARSGLDGAQAQDWMVQLERELDNFRAALEWASGDQTTLRSGLRLASALVEFWARRGYLSEGRVWLEAIMARVDREKVENDSTWETIRARALCALGELVLLQGELAEAHTYFEAALVLSRKMNLQVLTAEVLLGLGATAWTQANYDFAQKCFKDSLHLYHKAGDEHGSAMVLRRLGQGFRIQGQYATAEACYRQSQELFRKTGDQHGVAQALEGLGLIARLQGDLDRAQSLAEESLELRRSLQDRLGTSFSLINLGVIAYERRDAHQARAHLQECLDIRRTLGDQVGSAACINILGDVALDQGELQEAQRLFSESLAQRRLSGEKYGLIDDLRGLSQVCWRLEDYAGARVNLEEALAYARDLGVPRLIAATLRDLASRDLQLGDQQHCLENVRESLNLSRQQDDPIGVAESLEVLADAAVEAGQFEFALRLVAGAAGLRETAGLRRTPRQEPEAARRLAKIHAHLEKTLYDRLWDEFRRLPLDQIIEDVLESQDHQS